MKQVVDYVTQTHGYSQRKACSLTRQHRSTQRKPLRTDPLIELRQRMHEIVATWIRFGYRRVHIMLKREGWQVGKHIVYRLYREEGLCLRAKRPHRRKMAVHREARCQPSGLNQAWSLDFVHDQLSCGAKIRLLTVIDVYSRECLAIEVGSRLRGEDVAKVLNRLVYLRGTPTDNAHIESFNGSLRDECLNINWFASLAEAKRLIEAWRRDDNESRPHMSHNGQSPSEFARNVGLCNGGKVKSTLDFNAKPRPPDPSTSLSTLFLIPTIGQVKLKPSLCAVAAPPLRDW